MHKYGIEEKIADWFCAICGVYAFCVGDWYIARVLLTRPLFSFVYRVIYRMIILKIEDMVIEEMLNEHRKEMRAIFEKIKKGEHDIVKIDWE